MKMTAGQIATIIEGRIDGDTERQVVGPAKIEEANKHHISFLANLKYEEYAYQNQPGILIVSDDFEAKKPLDTTLIRVESVYLSVQKLLKMFAAERVHDGRVDASAQLHQDVQIGEHVSIGAYTVIDQNVILGEGVNIHPHVHIAQNVKIGPRTTIHSGVRIYPDTVIGSDCIIHSNSVIGSDGFGFAKNEEGFFDKIEHIGNVVIGDHVEIGANTTIDRAVMGSTIIGSYVKLDNLIQIAHNVEIGESTAIASQTGIAGSTKIGAHCLIGGQVAIIGHIRIADGVQLAAKTGVAQNITKPHSKWAGSPAVPSTQFIRSHLMLHKLKALWTDVSKIKKQLKTK